MTYEQALSYIHSLERFGINPGLERITALCNALGNPQDKLKFIHVAGTNGKGSTSTMLSEILQAGGYKTGLFTSPYVVDFCERIQINGAMILHADLAKTVTEIEPVISTLTATGLQLTEFESITAAAFLYFAQNKCDVVVLEVGLGGRFDSTNIINTPLVSVITSISFDHMAVLGDTIEKIAMEKCGIIKSKGLTVSYPRQVPEAEKVIKETACRMNNKLFVPDIERIKNLDENLFGTHVDFNGLKVFVPFMGEHMVFNASVAVTTAQALNTKGFTITDEQIANGIAKAKMPARMEIIGEEPLQILDGGHNEGCAKALVECIQKYLNRRKIIAVCGMMADKDYNTYIKFLAQLSTILITTKPKIERALDAQILADNAEKYCKNIVAIENTLEAYNYASNIAEKEDVIIICGSFFLASEVRGLIINSNKHFISRYKNKKFRKKA